MSFFAASTGSATTYPHTLYNGQFFKSHGVVGTRYWSERRISGVSYWGYVTTNASWVQQTANGNCNW